MNIILRELRASRKSLIIWSIVMALLVLVGVAKFAAYYNNPSMLAVLDALPKSMVDAMGLKAFNLTTLIGFYGIMFIYFGLLGGIAAAMWGTDLISKEERDKTVEFSLVLPISRSRLITGKAVAGLVNCIIFVLVTWVISIAAAQQYKPDTAFYNFLTLEMEAMFVIELIFLAMGLLLGCAMKRYKRSGSTAIGIILAAYFISIIAGMQSNLDFLKYFSPFKYFDAAALFHTGQMDAGYLLLSAVIIIACVAAAYWTYNKRDLYI